MGVDDPYPTEQYNWLVTLWENYQGIYSGASTVATAAEHNFMVVNYINGITHGLREFDDYTHSSDNYEGLAWMGLEYYGTTAGIITNDELNDLSGLSQIIYTDDHTNDCD